jgi:hypothetical protein
VRFPICGSNSFIATGPARAQAAQPATPAAKHTSNPESESALHWTVFSVSGREEARKGRDRDRDADRDRYRDTKRRSREMTFVFGEVRYVDPSITAVALISTIFFLAICEHLMNALEDYLQHSEVYMSMIKKIYRELMIMGPLRSSRLSLHSHPPLFSPFLPHRSRVSLSCNV